MSLTGFVYAGGSATNGLWLCTDPGAPKIQCETATFPENSLKCCWKSDPTSYKGTSTKGSSAKGNKSAKSGSGYNGVYICGDPGTENMEKCPYHHAHTTSKCCWPQSVKGNYNGNKSPKNAPKVNSVIKGKKDVVKTETTKISEQKVVSKNNK